MNLLGEGGMGAVYAAEHVEIGKKVALKFLHGELTSRPDVVARLVQEARAASAIAHRGIVDIHDIGTAADGARFLVMELLDGESLRAHLDREGALPVARAVGIAVSVLSALEAAHGKGIIHRDLKPENLFLDRTGGTEEVKLLDFGTAKMAEAVSRLTRTGAAWGTAHYMAPEQARGQSDIDLRADLYAMGVVLYEALTGRVPFDGENYNAVMFRVVSEEVPPPRNLRPDLPAELEAVILRALEKDRANRWQCASDLADALAPFGDVRPPVPSAAPSPSDSAEVAAPSPPDVSLPLPVVRPAWTARTAQPTRSVRPAIRPTVAALVAAAVLVAVGSVWLLWGAFSESAAPAVAAPVRTSLPAPAVPVPSPPPVASPVAPPVETVERGTAAPVAATAAAPTDGDTRPRPPDARRPRRRSRILTDTSEFDR